MSAESSRKLSRSRAGGRADQAGIHTGSRTATRTVTRTATRIPGDGVGGRGARRRSQLRRWWRRTRRTGARWWGAATRAVTPLGWTVIALALCGVLAGLTLAWIEGWFIAIAGLLLLAIALPFLLGSRAYHTSLTPSRPYVVAGDALGLDIGVENTVARPQLPAVIELPVGDALREVPVPLLGPHQSTTLSVLVPTEQRGVIRVGPLTVAKGDPLGLLKREVTWRDTHLLHVHPRTVPLPPNTAGLVRDLEGRASQRLTDSDLSFHAVREYAPGDAMRHVHWKSTAKTGKLMVRQYEESQSARVAVLVDARRDEYASDAEFELGVSVAASLSVQAVREGRERFVASAWTPGRLRPSVDGLEELPARSPIELLDAWAELEGVTDGLPFDTLMRSLAHSLRELSIVIVVTGSRVAVDRIRRAAVSFSPDVRVLAVRVDWLTNPRLQRLETLTIADVGALNDLPQLMLRGAL